MSKTLQEFLDRHADLVELAAGGRVAGFFRRTPGGLRLLDVNVMLAPDPLMCPSLDFCHEDSTLIAVDRWINRAALAGLLDSLKKERIVLHVLPESAELGGLSDWSVQWLDRPIAHQNEHLEWPIHIARAYSAELTGEDLAPITERWRRRLPLWTPSFRDMVALCQVLGVKNALYDRHDAAFWFYLPVPARIECVERTLEPAGIRIDVQNYGLEWDSLQVSVVGDHGSGNLMTSLTEFEAVDEQRGLWRGILKWEAAGLASVHLAHNGECIDQCEIGFPNLLTRAYEHIDAGLDKLANDLSPPHGSKHNKKIQDRFERAVTTIFSLLGLPSVHIGEGGDLVAADVLCRAASGDLLLVECSVRAVGPDKRAKLQGRARDLEGTLAGRGFPVRVIPVAVQADPASEGDPEWLIDRAALESLLQCVRNGVGPGDLLPS